VTTVPERKSIERPARLAAASADWASKTPRVSASVTGSAIRSVTSRNCLVVAGSTEERPISRIGIRLAGAATCSVGIPPDQKNASISARARAPADRSISARAGRRSSDSSVTGEFAFWLDPALVGTCGATSRFAAQAEASPRPSRWSPAPGPPVVTVNRTLSNRGVHPLSNTNATAPGTTCRRGRARLTVVSPLSPGGPMREILADKGFARAAFHTGRLSTSEMFRAAPNLLSGRHHRFRRNGGQYGDPNGQRRSGSASGAGIFHRNPSRRAKANDSSRTMKENPKGHPSTGLPRNDRTLAEILTIVGAAPLVTVTGPVGAGRTTLLNQLRTVLSDRGTRTPMLRLSPSPVTTPLYAALRSVEARPAPTWWSSVDSPFGVPAVGTPRQTAAAIAQSLVAAGNTVLLIDDAQWMDLNSVAVLENLIQHLAGTTVSCVCAIRVPMRGAVFTAGCAALDRLRQDGLARQVNLRLLSTTDITTAIAAEFEARPDPELVAHLRHLTGGLPAALDPLIKQYRQDGSVRVVDDHAHLAPRRRNPTLPDQHPLLMDIRRAGPLAWSAAKAVSVLHPLGDAVPRLVGEALDIPATAAREVLDELREAGVLRYSSAGRRWRFRVPLVASALSVHLGPYEQRYLARHAITALWQGSARCQDPDYPADQLAVAGRLVDPQRARSELLAHAAAAAPRASRYDERWLRSAAALSDDRSDQAQTLLAHAAVSLVHGDYRQTLLSSETIRRDLDDRLGADELQELDRVHVLALHAVGESTSLDELAADADPRRSVARATALLLRGRWRECAALLEKNRDVWREPPMSAYFGHLIEAQVHFFLGRRELAEQSIDAAYRRVPETPHRQRYELAGFHVLTTLVTDGAGAAEKLLANITDATDATGFSVPPGALPPATQAVLAMRQGRFDQAMELARQVIVADTVRGHDPAHTFLHQAAATIQLSRGKLSRGRELLLAARATDPPLPYLLDGAEALIDRALGRLDQACKRLRHGLAHAAEHGLVVETDRLWRELAELELVGGDLPAARRCADEVDWVAGMLPTTGTALNQRLAGALCEHDQGAAAEAVRLARELAQPVEFADVIAKLVAHGLADPALLAEAYETLDGLGALLNRAWLRNLMAEHGISIPGRRQTVAENERLLSVLVADGLGNKQIATVLQTSEKSVESRLGRLFSRTGYRSRVELAMAVLTGAYAE
jgi:DNA-binding CsgD family transcriptional regulator